MSIQRSQISYISNPGKLSLPLHGLAILALAVSVVLAKGPALHGQTVQLPVFSNFSYSGAVRVPDGGSIRAGSIKTLSEGSTSRGVPLLGGIPGVNRGFQNRGIGRETGSGDLNINPTIIDMSEMEEDHLAAAGYGPDGKRAGFNDSVAVQAAFLTEHMGRLENPPPPRSSRKRPR